MGGAPPPSLGGDRCCGPWLLGGQPAAGVEANTAGSEALFCTSDRPHGRRVGQFMGRKWAKRFARAQRTDALETGGQSLRRLGHEDRATVSLFLLSPAEGSVCQGSTGPWERTTVGEKQDGSPHHQADSPHTTGIAG